MEIGRETTAVHKAKELAAKVYHMEIGRETTAVVVRCPEQFRVYHIAKLAI